MGFLHLMFLPSHASFYTTFLNNCCRGEGVMITTCLKTVVWVSKGMLSVKYFHSNKAFFVSVKFQIKNQIMRLLQR